MSRSVGFFDRLISVLTYVTAGWAGLIYCVIMYFRKRNPSIFVKYNVFQSIFISLMFLVLSMALELVLKFLSYIPFVNYLAAQISFLLNKPVFFDYSLIQLFLSCLVIYFSIFSALGKFPRIYWVSEIIDRSVR